MSTYLVTKRIKEDRVYLPGEMLVDPLNADILMARGFLTPVPDNFVPPTPTPTRHERRRLEQESTAAANDDDSSEEPEVTLDELLKLNRQELNELALEAGIEDPDELPNKAKVAEAILAKADEDKSSSSEPSGDGSDADSDEGSDDEGEGE